MGLQQQENNGFPCGRVLGFLAFAIAGAAAYGASQADNLVERGIFAAIAFLGVVYGGMACISGEQENDQRPRNTATDSLLPGNDDDDDDDEEQGKDKKTSLSPGSFAPGQ